VTRDLRNINAALEAYEKAHGEKPRDVKALVEAGFLYVEPRDPAGNSYLIQDGVALSSMEYEKLHPHLNP
jgi:hypothetical protein